MTSTMKIFNIIMATLLAASVAGAEEITLIAVGDIMPTAKALPFINNHGFGYPYNGTREILQSGDIVIGNLEMPLTVKGERFDAKEYTFKAPIETAAALKDAGFTHLSLANNHMMDYGKDGLISTLAALDEAGLNYAGAGENIGKAREVSITEIKGKKIAFLSYSKTYPVEFYADNNRSGTAPGYRDYVEMDTKMASGAADIVIVAFHWGGEKLEQPRQYQREFARLAIDNGADIVLGHHPHVLQGIEHYKGGIIFYSLGNFAFGSYSPSAKESIIAKIALDEKGVSSIEAIPINVDNFEVHFRPEALDGERGTAVISKLSRLSEQLGTRLSFKDGRGKALKIEKTTMR